MSTPSIFNDVLGPVMRGPSSSHCAAALRIGRICRDLMKGSIHKVVIDYDPTGSLATTHKGQGSDMGLFGGFLGWEAHDERLPHYEEAVAEAGIDIHINKFEYGAEHPNTYRMALSNGEIAHDVTAISVGGGMIEIIEIDGSEVSIVGDFYETIIFGSDLPHVQSFIRSLGIKGSMKKCEGKRPFIQWKTETPFSIEEISNIKNLPGVSDLTTLNPVLPILSRENLQVPFITVDEMTRFNEGKNLSLWELALIFESARGNLTEQEVYEKMRELVEIMRTSIESGLRGTSYDDRILGSQSLSFAERMKTDQLVEGDVLNTVVLYVSAMMEVKSSMGVIVAAPTAGACGALPGVVLGTQKALDLSEEIAIKGMLAAGLIGVFIASGASFAAEVGGCQAECGSGSCMAAAALVTMKEGTVQQALGAASQALQNSLGMICDPIANRVEAPCLGKNVLAASNAISCANMALADYNALIPLDQVIATMARVSEQMVHELRCTSLGGLAITAAAKEIEASLESTDAELASAHRSFKIC